jgi:hypothetical protein
VKKILLVSLATALLFLGASRGDRAAGQDNQERRTARDVGQSRAKRDFLPPLDARGFNGVREISRTELVKLMSQSHLLSQEENADLDRGCPGLTCLFQGLGQKRWPELTAGTRGYLNRRDALSRQCPNGHGNFIFLKQGCWLGDKPPPSDPVTGEVPVNSVTRARPGLYTFNYAVYFQSTATYAWMDHRNYGFPINQIRPQTVYLSHFPPPLDEDVRPAQIYCSTCR